MKQTETIKRYSVFINGLLYRLFETTEEARRWVCSRYRDSEIAEIWDNLERKEVETIILL
jgi:hypothetical protein